MDETVEEEVVEEIKEQKIVYQTKTNTPISQHVSEVTTPAMDNNNTSSVTSSSNNNSASNNTASNNTAIPNVVITAAGVAPSISTVSESSKPDSMLKFSDMDSFIDTNNREEIKNAPKDIERLEEISNMRYEQRKLEMENDDDKLQISDQDINLSDFDIHNFDEQPPSANSIPELLFNDIEEII